MTADSVPADQPTSDKLDTWAVVELFGHARIAGKVAEQTIAGGAFLRVDVPAVDGQVPRWPPFTRFFGAGAIYSISPCSEQVARLVAKTIRMPPISVYVPELDALPPASRPGESVGGDLGDDF